ncbi:hypothetical protein NP493_1773g00028 [Ridgeia piscesae]|uniref:Uncharacterized protein n=1 Tax=Ridgeia piscesae TaxID=27915 RepID=A0AAD9N968_RIDPI|nr:hypothetical protein NP493_1773g00028 [Ridgeia piscesae]
MAVFRGVEFMPSIVAYPVFGAFMIVAGILGIFAGKLKKTGPIVAFMVMSIIVSVFAVYAFISCFLFGLGFIVVLSGDTSGRVLIAVMFLFVVAYLVEVIVSIWSAVICCRAVCCGRRETPGAILAYHQVKQTETND